MSSEYEPVYFSRAYAWLNDVNITDEEYEKRIKDMKLIEQMVDQFLTEFARRNISMQDVRQVLRRWMFVQAFYDEQWLDFDKKVERDTLQFLKQNMPTTQSQ